MELHNLKSGPGARKEKHRVGRGHAAGKGKQAGRGQSGQRKRGSVRLGFEGGQNPWFRRVPKRGFNNINHVEYQVVSLGTLAKVFTEADLITPELLHKNKLARKSYLPIKLLANGEVDKKLNIQINAASQKAIEKIEKFGGKVDII